MATVNADQYRSLRRIYLRVARSYRIGTPLCAAPSAEVAQREIRKAQGQMAALRKARNV